MSPCLPVLFFFFFNDTATTEIYTLSLHDALPISCHSLGANIGAQLDTSKATMGVTCEACHGPGLKHVQAMEARSEEHTSELQSQSNLVCRLLLEKKKKKTKHIQIHQNHTIYNYTK